ncbi:hypothetical protein SLE2022_117120 [Rubroshorea leprosula]
MYKLHASLSPFLSSAGSLGHRFLCSSLLSLLGFLLFSSSPQAPATSRAHIHRCFLTFYSLCHLLPVIFLRKNKRHKKKANVHRKISNRQKLREYIGNLNRQNSD